jgi:putative hydrolase of the HAD superfamily
MSEERWILWDFDGTLAARHGMWSGALVETLAKCESLECDVAAIRPYLQAGFPWHSPNEAHEHLRTPEQWWAQLFPIFERAFIGVGIAPRRAADLARQVPSTYLDTSRWQLFEDAIPTLKNHIPELHSLVCALGLDNYVSNVFSSATLGYEKPHPLAYARALDALGRPSRVWMIGDSYTADVAGAVQAGLRAILVRSEHEEALLRCATLEGVPNVIAA